MVTQFVLKQQGRNSFGQPGDMLGHIDQRHREIARSAQNRSPSVQTSTTSPVVAPPRCQSMITQASNATVNATVIAAWVIRSLSR